MAIEKYGLNVEIHGQLGQNVNGPIFSVAAVLLIALIFKSDFASQT